ncbi:MAG: MFS transporter [Candidatus Thermoplasmatota archaeon]|nr:MFS transporter [Candidatus Thermoplasmatota archaeon]
MNTVHLGNNYLWISYESLILPLQIQGVASSQDKGIILGIFAFVGTSVGVFISLFTGVLSDRFSIGWGRRGPYIFLGSMAAALVVFSSRISSISLWWIFLLYSLVQVFSNISAGAYQPLFRDLVGEGQRGLATGFNGLFTLLGTAMGLGLIGYLTGEGLYSLSLVTISVIIIATSLLTIITIARDDHPVHVGKLRLKETFLDIFDPKGKSKGFFHLVLGSFFFFMGITGLSFFELYYFSDILKATNPENLVAISGVVVLAVSTISSVTFGTLSDRLGRKNILIFAAIVGGLATSLIPLLRIFSDFLILGAVIGSCYGVYFSVSKALATDLSPGSEAGKFMSYFNLAIGGSAAFSPLLFGSILGIFKNSSLVGYTVLFELSALMYLLCLLFIRGVPSKPISSPVEGR